MDNAIFTPNDELIVETAGMARVNKICQLNLVVRLNSAMKRGDVIGKLALVPVLAFSTNDVDITTTGELRLFADHDRNSVINVSTIYITEG